MLSFWENGALTELREAIQKYQKLTQDLKDAETVIRQALRGMQKFKTKAQKLGAKNRDRKRSIRRRKDRDDRNTLQLIKDISGKDLTEYEEVKRVPKDILITAEDLKPTDVLKKVVKPIMDLKYIGILKHYSLLSIGALDKLTSVINSKKKRTTDFVNLVTANLYAPPEEEDMEEDLDENANTLEDEQGDEVIIEESDDEVIVESDESELSDDCRYGDFYETYHDKELE